MTVLITGAAGFIGFNLSKRILEEGISIIGLDNLNSYYDPSLKKARLEELYKISKKTKTSFNFIEGDLENNSQINEVFEKYNPQKVVNLAAQAGVRYSIENPSAYIQTNLLGFSNILEACRKYSIKHLVYASSSSVYGGNTNMPFSEQNSVDHPVSLYAATKRANELLAHSYSHLYGIPSTGLRFFTVYGPWGRPDMALFKFVKNIKQKKEIEVFNYGNHQRDFTYVKDISRSIIKLISKSPKMKIPFEILNIGNSKPVKLEDFIKVIEKKLNIKAKVKYLPLQKGDIPNTNSNSGKLYKKIKFRPKTNYKSGITKFINWYQNYYEKN